VGRVIGDIPAQARAGSGAAAPGANIGPGRTGEGAASSAAAAAGQADQRNQSACRSEAYKAQRTSVTEHLNLFLLCSRCKAGGLQEPVQTCSELGLCSDRFGADLNRRRVEQSQVGSKRKVRPRGSA